MLLGRQSTVSALELGGEEQDMFRIWQEPKGTGLYSYIGEMKVK